MDGTTLIAIGVAFFTVVIPLWAVIDIVRRPHWQWQEAGKNRQLWLILMIVSIVFFFGGILMGVWYFFRIQPHLRNAHRVDVRKIAGSVGDLPPDDPRAQAYRDGLGSP